MKKYSLLFLTAVLILGMVPATALAGEPIAIPNMCFYRNNEYGRSGKPEYGEIEFGEEMTYHKTAGTASETAFCAVAVDRDAERIHVLCYGAGYDRVVDFGKQ